MHPAPVWLSFKRWIAPFVRSAALRVSKLKTLGFLSKLKIAAAAAPEMNN
jgi:hypothetical protein